MGLQTTKGFAETAEKDEKKAKNFGYAISQKSDMERGKTAENRIDTYFK